MNLSRHMPKGFILAKPLATRRDTASTAAARDILDPTGLGTLPVVPLVPEPVLRQHHCCVPSDQLFRSAARLLQALWREDRDLAPGSFIDEHRKRHKIGSSITRAAGQAGANIFSPEITQVVHRELAYRELGSLYDVHRLRTNLLSSMPLTFNLFALLKRDLDLATRFVAEVFPNFMAQVTSVQFEHSPGRGDTRFTGDHSAFDVFVRGTTPRGSRAFIAFEVKYSESMQEQLPLRFSDRLTDIAVNGSVFADVEMSGLW